jgi:tRNA-specific 2-thiouridylase
VLGIPFYVWDLAERFHEDVVEDFVAEYAAGRTPNPCLRCNEKIKFAACWTGRWRSASTPSSPATRPAGTRRRAAPRGRRGQGPVLRARGADRRSSSPHAMFPLGDSTKAEVRAEAAERGLAVADKPDSHDICFIADGDTAAPSRSAGYAAPSSCARTAESTERS